MAGTALDAIPSGVVVGEPLATFLRAVSVGPGGQATIPPGRIPSLLGLSVTAPATGTAILSAGAPFSLQLDLPAITVAAPAAVSAAVRNAVGSGGNQRVTYSSPSPLTFTITGRLLVSVSADGVATLAPGDSFTITPSTPTMLLPNGFGLALPATMTAHDGAFALPNVELAMPANIPLVGGLLAICTLTLGPNGIDVTLPFTSPLPGVTGTLTWRVGADADLDALAPTGISIALALPSATPTAPVAQGPVGSHSVTFRFAASRLPGDPTSFTTTLSAESTAPDGLLSTGPSDSPGDKAGALAVVLAPAVISATGSAPAAGLAATIAAAATLQTFANRGGVTMHRLSFTGSTGGVQLDVSGAVAVKDLGIPPITISMRPDHPLRVRWNNIQVDLGTGSADPVIDVSHARPEVVDPGGWKVTSPGNLLDIVGTRSGSGSTWFEVDLRFALDLGPLRISGATVRATLNSDGSLDVGIRGLEASLTVPGMVTGTGKVAVTNDATSSGIDLVLSATVIPINLGALAHFSTAVDKATGVRRIQLGVAVDLPAPIALGSTGLGLYGIDGDFGTNAALPPLGDDPLASLRAWRPWDRLDTKAGDITLGLGVVVGTLADGAHLVSARGVLGLTVPDLALRIGVEGRILGERYKFADIRADPSAPGAPLVLFGGLSATPDALDIGIQGNLTVANIVTATLPSAGHLPFDHPENWWFRVGSDKGIPGPHSPERPPGPVRATVFPNTPFAADGWAFLMTSGNGLDNLMGNQKSMGGFVIAAGAGFTQLFGVRHVLWAELTTAVAAAIASHPTMLWVRGGISGEFGIGPFSLGADATLELDIGPGDRLAYHLQVCGEVDLWLTTLRRCITISNDAAAPQLPDPETWPFPAVRLTDGLGRSLTTPADLTAGRLAKDSPAANERASLTDTEWSETPVVWPDTIPLLDFPVAPLCDPPLDTSGVHNTGVVSSGNIAYTWRLTDVRLEDVTGGATIPVSDQTRTWQRPQGIPDTTAGTSMTRQLALLSPFTGHVDAALADGGATAPTGFRPADYIGGRCAWRPAAARGWSLGGDARSTGTRSWHAPRARDTFGFPPVLGAFDGGTGFTATSADPSADPLATAYSGLAAREGPYPFGPATVEARTIDAVLGLPGIRILPRDLRLADEIHPEQSLPNARHVIIFDEPVREGSLYLTIGDAGDEMRELARSFAVVTRVDGSHQLLQTRVVSDDPLVFEVFVPAAPAAAISVSLRCPVYTIVGVVGLYALTVADADAAQRAKDNAAAEATKQMAGKTSVLPAAKRFRIAVTMTWHRDATVAGTEVSADGPTRTRYWFFRTAVETAALGKPVWKKAVTQFSPLALLSAVDTFDPRYLQRYLDGYLPADHTLNHFTTDAVGATFGACHVVNLLKAYGRATLLYLRRTDRPRPPVLPTAGIIALITDPLRPLDVLVSEAATAAGCVVPPSGIRITWPGALDPNATYEMSVVFPKLGSITDDDTPGLDGITFRTSAYANPTEQMATLGLEPIPPTNNSPAAHPSGDLLVTAIPVTPGTHRADTDVELAFAALELPPPQPVDSPLSSVLWAKTAAGWCIVGVLFQSPEPMVRDLGRMDVTRVAVGNVTATARYVNTSGTLMLWLLPAPMENHHWTTMLVTFTDRGSPLTYRSHIDASPAFAAGALTAGRA